MRPGNIYSFYTDCFYRVPPVHIAALAFEDMTIICYKKCQIVLFTLLKVCRISCETSPMKNAFIH